MAKKQFNILVEEEIIDDAKILAVQLKTNVPNLISSMVQVCKKDLKAKDLIKNKISPQK